MKNNRIRIAAMSDSPKLHSGFGTVVEQLYQGFHDADFEVHAFGFMDAEYDFEHRLPYYFYPCNIFDELAHKTYRNFLRKIKPDIIFIMTDPGNLIHYAEGIVYNEAATYLRNGREFIPPIIAYCPIEGLPLMESFKTGFECVLQTGGRVVLYNETAKQNVEKMGWNDIASAVDVIPHGLDHAPFRRYSDEERQTLKELVGLEKYFVIGSVGTNKRTKGFVELIYTARCLKDMGCADNIKFYCHTNPHMPTMEGYLLIEIAQYYGVEDMMLWRQAFTPGNYNLGIPRDNGSVDALVEIAGKTPDSPEKRGLLFTKLDFVSMLNCMDMYVDLSSNEGWCLPTGEAMACGVPTLMLNDYDTRAETYGSGVYLIEPTSERLWATHRTGARLVGVDPMVVANEILAVKSNDRLLKKLSESGREVAAKYKWDDAKSEFVRIAKEVAEFVFEEDVAYAS